MLQEYCHRKLRCHFRTLFTASQLAVLLHYSDDEPVSFLPQFQQADVFDGYEIHSSAREE